MIDFIPKQVFYEPESLNYPVGKKLVDYFQKINIPVKPTTSHNRVTGIKGNTPSEAYRESKHTLVIGVRRSKTFQTCKPSAHYQLPLATSCPGMCEYCYLSTTLGPKPYLRVYVNIGEILDIAKNIIESRAPEITIFEGAATSDPIPVEKYTGNLKNAIEFFGQEALGRFRFVTKFTDVDSLLELEHNNHTRFRFSINCQQVIDSFEHKTPSLVDRIIASSKVLKAGYPLGFIIAPIFKFKNWKDEYTELFVLLDKYLYDNLPSNWSPDSLTFEFISHRFTARAKTNITNVFPKTKLPMEEEERKFKFGQFGYGKYLYNPSEIDEFKEFFLTNTGKYFPGAKIEYFI